MMSFFKLKKSFTSSLSASEAINNLGQLLSTKSKFLFFSFHEHVGAIQVLAASEHIEKEARYQRPVGYESLTVKLTPG